jgi:hypothetical protein
MVRVILHLVKRKTGLTWQDKHVLLLGCEHPRKLPAPVGIEVHFDALGALNGNKAFHPKMALADDWCTGKPGRGTEHAIE